MNIWHSNINPKKCLLTSHIWGLVASICLVTNYKIYTVRPWDSQFLGPEKSTTRITYQIEHVAEGLNPCTPTPLVLEKSHVNQKSR